MRAETRIALKFSVVSFGIVSSLLAFEVDVEIEQGEEKGEIESPVGRKRFFLSRLCFVFSWNTWSVVSRKKFVSNWIALGEDALY